MALRPVQASLLGGSLVSLFLRAAEDLLPPAFEAPPIPFSCPAVDFAERVHIPSLVLGILVGLAAGPVIDLVYLLRVWWTAFVRERLAVLRPRTGPLYRIL